MAESAGESERSNGVHGEAADKVEVEVEFERRRDGRAPPPPPPPALHAVLYRMISTVLFPDFTSRASGERLARRIKISLADDWPVLREASWQTGRHILHWTRRGSPLRALLVVSIGTIAFLALTGLLVFMLFFLAATINAIVISLLMSMAAVGSVLALFLACVTAIYVGALAVAFFVISTATCSAVLAVVVATGWIGFLWTVWLATKKSVDLAKHTIGVTGSAISAYSTGRHSHHHQRASKILD
ncbi:uncharacterized protein LOC115745405 [Rhodamnia argentea]|uniref:Uncharacterized protein LOC115745405 n=1 Tax=Rhodamnia argentea TaxID=178133 RepID=A0A8B8PPS8_9MYRT|nr:uncharacterized protein LOC115745405 [Rhodamnia argentea]